MERRREGREEDRKERGREGGGGREGLSQDSTKGRCEEKGRDIRGSHLQPTLGVRVLGRSNTSTSRALTSQQELEKPSVCTLSRQRHLSLFLCA